MRTATTPAVATGSEWLIDAHGCDPGALRSIDTLADLFNGIVADLRLKPLAEAVWHQFPETGGITGLLLLQESHLACHSFPEAGFVALNLYCCAARERWPWEDEIARRLGARTVLVRSISRGRVD